MKKAEHYRLFKYGDKTGTPLTRAEAERAVYAMATGKVFLCKNEAIAGSAIMSIKADFNKVMGFNPDYVLIGEDYGEVKRYFPEYINAMDEINTRVKHLIETKREHLIGTLVEIPELEVHAPKEISAQSAQIAENFRIK